MAQNSFDDFYKQLEYTIDRKTTTLYPIMGIIHHVSISREYVDVKTEDGIISNIPAHGFPVIGDSCIIHFINGNIEQPVCDCARRLAPPPEQYKEMITHDCNNYLPNGDFNQKDEGYTGNYELLEEEGFVTTGSYYCELQNGHYIEFDCDITECKTKYFKFQANYRGNGVLKIECYDKDTEKQILPAPENIAEETTLWVSEEGRFQWVFNKEAYPKNNTTHIHIKITNCTTELIDIPKKQLGEELVEIPTSVSLDGLLVYDENGDRTYYWNEEDALKNNNLS